MDDLDKSIQFFLDTDPKFRYIHNKLISLGYELGDFPEDLIYEVAVEYDNQLKCEGTITVDTGNLSSDELINTLKNIPAQTYVRFSRENKRAKKVGLNEWEVGDKALDLKHLFKRLGIERPGLNESIEKALME